MEITLERVSVGRLPCEDFEYCVAGMGLDWREDRDRLGRECNLQCTRIWEREYGQFLSGGRE